MNTTTSTEPRYTVEQYGTQTFVVIDATTKLTVRSRFGLTRYFTSHASARKAITRLNRPVGDRHR
jgi:hypothetical protein